MLNIKWINVSWNNFLNNFISNYCVFIFVFYLCFKENISKLVHQDDDTKFDWFKVWLEYLIRNE